MRARAVVILLIVFFGARFPCWATEEGKLTADYVCVPEGYEAFDSDDMLAAYNVFSARYIPHVPGSVSINKAHVVGRCVFILWTWYKQSPAFQGPATQYFYLLTRDADRPCFFTLTDIGSTLSGKDSGKAQTVGTIDFSKLTADYSPAPGFENVLRISGVEKAVCDGPAAQNLAMGMNRPNYCFSGYVGLPVLVGTKKFFDSLMHIYTKMCSPLVIKPDLR
jgi:hypothetical protein